MVVPTRLKFPRGPEPLLVSQRSLECKWHVKDIITPLSRWQELRFDLIRQEEVVLFRALQQET